MIFFSVQRECFYFCIPNVAKFEMMNIRKYILLVIAIALFWGCNSEKGGNIIRNDKVKVYITASSDLATRSSFEDEVIVVDTEPAQSANTRTELGPVKNETNSGDEQKIYWSEDDSFVMWAAPTGTTTYNLGYNAKVFERDTYNYDFNTADFVTELGSAMDATQKYDYYAVYPITNDPNFGKIGTTVTYNLKTTQSGDYDPAMDVMYATVTNANALVPRNPKQTATNDRVWDEPELHFNHMLHTLRIWVPAGKNLMGNPIKRLDIVFPRDVVGGTLSFSAANPTQPTWKGQSDRVTIEFADGDLLDAEGRYVWVYIMPEDNLSGSMTFRAYDQNGVPSKAITTTLSNHNFQAQHITPIKLTIPQKLEPVRVEFSCPDDASYPNFLGETATEMVVKSWPAGIAAATTKLSATDGKFTADFYYDGGDIPVNQELAGATMSAGFKSASADVSDIAYTVKMPDVLSEGQNVGLNYALPYLLYQDFSQAVNASDNLNTTGVNNPDEVVLTNYGVTDWMASRFQLHAGKAIQVSVRHETAAQYPGRLDSSLFSRIKNGTTIGNVTVAFNASRTNKYVYLWCGRRSGSDILTGYIDDNKNRPEADRIDITPALVSNASADNIPIDDYLTIPLTSVNNQHRIVWIVEREYDFLGNGWELSTWYVYFDNIKVSIGGTAKHTEKDYRSFFPNHVN